MLKIPTDLQILDTIYNQYHDTFQAFDKIDPDRATKVYVPVDSKLIGSQLGVDPDIVFGRLYYHLEHKYGYTQSDGTTKVHLFTLRAGSDTQCVNFPFMASVLAGLQDDADKQARTRLIAWGSLAVSIAAVVISVVIT